MSDVATATIIVLWESELRAAAKALSDFYQALSANDMQRADVLLRGAIEACSAALKGITASPDAQVIVGNDERLKYVPRITQVPSKTNNTTPPPKENP